MRYVFGVIAMMMSASVYAQSPVIKLTMSDRLTLESLDPSQAVQYLPLEGAPTCGYVKNVAGVYQFIPFKVGTCGISTVILVNGQLVPSSTPIMVRVSATPTPTPTPAPSPTPSPTPTPLPLTVNLASVAKGASITVSWTGVTNPTAQDWIGLYPVNAPDANLPSLQWRRANGQPAGSVTILAPSTAGQYHARYFRGDTYNRILTSATFTVF